MTLPNSWSFQTLILVGSAVAVASALMAVGLWWVRLPKSPVRTHAIPWFWRRHVTLIAIPGEPLAARLWPAADSALSHLAKRSGWSVELPVASIVGAMALAAGYGALLGIFLICALDFGGVSMILSTTSLGGSMPLIWLRDHAERREREVFRALPFLLDVLTLALEAGSNLGAALAIAVDRLHPGALRDEMSHLLQDLRAGRPRTEAFAALADRIRLPAVANLVAALQIAERQGASLGSVLRAQAQASRATRWLRAERQAMQAPVRMMLPLTVCIFPGTFAVLLFPVAMRLMQEGFGR